MKKYILGYAMNHSFPTITEADVKKLTHLNLAFGLIKDGLLDMSQLTNIDLLPTFRKWNPKLKIVLSVGGWGAASVGLDAWDASVEPVATEDSVATDDRLVESSSLTICSIAPRIMDTAIIMARRFIMTA